MNKAITDGLVLDPPPFKDGLGVWSSTDGTAGSPTYDGAVNAVIAPADQDFGDCLELFKDTGTMQVRWMGQTPIEPGCYLRVTVRLKAMSGNLPSVRIAGYAGNGAGAVTGVPLTGPSVALTSYGEIVEVSAIVGTGSRPGVDLPWGTAPTFGHVGFDLTGATGGVIRVDNIRVEDITSAFYRTMMDWVDVVDYGAVGDGVTDDSAAFNAADAAAAGREILVPAGTYRLEQDVSLDAPVRFEGTVTMPDDKRLILRGNYHLPAYIEAFGDEVLAFKKAFQALLHFSDHESLDMGGRRVDLDGPIDMHAAVATLDTFEIRRVIRNGQFNVQPSTNWDPGVTTSTASYNSANPKRLTNVANVANIEVGSLVEGNGVGREVYVSARNVGAGTIDLSQPLYGANASQSYTFTRFRYILDFSGFTKMSKMNLAEIDFQCAATASAVMIPVEGDTFHLKDCHITQPSHRGVTSIGQGCQDLHIDRCNFLSSEMALPATQRQSVGFNVNANDAKIRDNRFARLGTTGVMFGNGHLIVGNHWFQGDEVTDGPRVAGLVLTETNMKTVITGNYIDNSFIELTNEHDAEPDFSNEFSFGGVTMTGNIFTANDVASSFAWIVITPYGAGHFIQGLSVIGNTFKSLNGSVDRVEKVDDSFAGLDFSRTRNVTFEGNTFNNVTQPTINPVALEFEQASATTEWVLDVSGYLPFGGWARTVEAVMPKNEILDGANNRVTGFPFAKINQGPQSNFVSLTWPSAAKGKVLVTTRVDKPV